MVVTRLAQEVAALWLLQNLGLSPYDVSTLPALEPRDPQGPTTLLALLLVCNLGVSPTAEMVDSTPFCK